MLGPYLLAQACVVATLWNVMALGRSIVGRQHAALAILLTVGVVAISMPSPDFGPWVLAMPLWSLTLLQAWRAIAEGRRRSWFALALAIGLLFLTSYFAIVFVVLLDLFFLATVRGRATLRTPDPWLAIVMVAIIVFPYAFWLSQQTDILAAFLDAWRTIVPLRDAAIWLQLIAALLLAHVGVLLLAALASGWPHPGEQRVPAVTRHSTEPLGTAFLLYFAIATPLATSLAAAVYLPRPPLVAGAPVVVLTTLALIVMAGQSIPLHRQRALAYAWLAFLLAPPVVIALTVAIVPRLLPFDLRVAQPADAIGRFFGESFERRTGQPLAIVAGDRRLASLVAARAASHPRLFIDEATTPWLTRKDIEARGAVVVWPAGDTPGTPPTDIASRVPGLVPEVPRVFDRPLQGFGVPLRVGWAVIRSRKSEVGNQKPE
jgi:hypothetical protein